MNLKQVDIATPFSVALFLFGWALTPVFVRYMSDAYDPYTQAFIRYISAAAALCLYSLLFYRRDLMRAIANWRVLVPMSAMIICMQLAWTIAIYNTTATMAQLVTTLQAPLVILLSFAVFHEERAVIRSPGYIVGSLLCLVGVTAVFMRDDGESVRIIIDFAMILLLFVSISWSVYAVWGRHTAKGLHPVAMFTVISVYVSIGFIFTMCAFGAPTTLWSAGAHMNGIAFISGVVCIAAAHCGFHYAQVRLGSAYCTSIQLGTPFITHLLAFALWPDEALLWIQWAGGVMLVGGGFLVVRARRIQRTGEQ
ncbi:MAG TPA: DMT family transporter [Candidatus Hydrogenedentes bacterium]|nr:DMT family transporter [Candidatus Hydrogenedentota bacterium]